MKNNMQLRQFIDEVGIHKILQKDVVSKLIELEAIDNWIRVTLGVELEINVKPITPQAGRFYGKEIVRDIQK